MTLEPQIRQELLKAQRNEITEYHIYRRLAKRVRDKSNSATLGRIAEDERRHAEIWRRYTNVNVKPSRLKVLFFLVVARVAGLTFGVKLMEKGEESAQINYNTISSAVPEAAKIEEEENAHERELIEMIHEERLEYVGSIVLGLNDALVELTGALAGLTFALQDATLIALAGLITGIAASFSMAASEYLSMKSEGEADRALKGALYTGSAYIVTVILLVLPFLVLANFFVSLAVTLGIAVLIILFFNFYISIAKDMEFRRRFLEMAGLSLGVAAFSFGVGYLIRIVLGVEV